MVDKRQKTLDLFPEETGNSENAGSPGASSDSLPPDAQPHADAELTGKLVVVIDSHSLIYQVYHAIAEMTSPAGHSVNAIFGFTRDVLDILKKHKPDYLFCAFDLSEITFRNELYSDYKAHRDPMPDDLQWQIPQIQRLLTALAIPILTSDGYEADDILATIARVTVERGGRCLLVTNDKDCRQLINDRVNLLNIRKGLIYDAQALQFDWGIRPDQVVDYQAMVGDATDNVPGIPTIGPKTATQLLQQFGSLDNLLARVSEVPGKKAQRIEESRDLAKLSQQLVALDPYVPIDIDWRAGEPVHMDIDQAVEICQEFGFRGLTEQIKQLAPRQSHSRWQSNYRTITQLSDLHELVSRLKSERMFSFDTETTHVSPRWAELVGLSLGWQAGEAVYVPLMVPSGEPHLELRDVLAALEPLWQDPECLLIGQNIKYDLVVLRNYGVVPRCRLFDTMVADFLVNPGRHTHNLDDLALRFLDHKTIKISELIGSGKSQRRMDEVPLAAIAAYAAQDADIPWRLKPMFESMLEQQGLSRLFHEVEMPLVHVLAEMESLGVAVDRQVLTSISQEFSERLSVLEHQIVDLAGEPFNVDSPTQLARIMFEKLGLRSVKKTKAGHSTDIEVLEVLSAEHPLPRCVIEYRQLAKLKNTYADVLVNLIHPQTGRIHTSFMQDVARTGRLSSKDPNLQNIPIRTEEGRRIRQAFVACDSEHLLITADYSQIELRMLAHFSEDAVLMNAFQRDEDIHAAVAADIHGVEIGLVTADMRRQAKAINFGIIYGQSPYGLARELGIGKDEAARFIEAYFERYPAVDRFIQKTLENAATNGFVSTILGRRRAVEGVRDPRQFGYSRSRTPAERIAINTVIQGSAADLIKLAMIRLAAELPTRFPGARLLLQIHDELVLEVQQGAIELLGAFVAQVMMEALPLRVPLKVTVEAGPNWNDTHELNLSEPS
ncbi:MAG TPA: DNA polymerase I [Pirellulaceae bacterium]|nr:DNA polymerase I [Pirellulaceae bacterium]